MVTNSLFENSCIFLSHLLQYIHKKDRRIRYMKNIGKIILYIFAGLTIVYGIAVLAISIINSENFISGILENIPVVLVGGVFSAILIISAKGAWGGFLRKFGRKYEAEAYDAAMATMNQEEEINDNYKKSRRNRTTFLNKGKAQRNGGQEDYPMYAERRPKLTGKDFLISLVILVIGCGLFGIFFAINNSQVKKASNPNCIETTATLQYVNVKDSDRQVLRFVYSVYNEEEGKNIDYLFTSNTTFTGVNCKAGKTITILYNKYTPEVALLKPNPTRWISLGALCLAFGILVAVLNLFFPVDPVRAIGVGGIFFIVPYFLIFSIANAFGLSLFETLFNGAGAYAAVLFMCLSIYFIAYGVITIVKILRRSTRRKDADYERI